MEKPQNHYQTLRIDRDATGPEITTAFRNLAKGLHPDLNPGMSADEFRELRTAYETLSNPHKKKAYDRTLNPSSNGWIDEMVDDVMSETFGNRGNFDGPLEEELNKESGPFSDFTPPSERFREYTRDGNGMENTFRDEIHKLKYRFSESVFFNGLTAMLRFASLIPLDSLESIDVKQPLMGYVVVSTVYDALKVFYRMAHKEDIPFDAEIKGMEVKGKPYSCFETDMLFYGPKWVKENSDWLMGLAKGMLNRKEKTQTG